MVFLFQIIVYILPSYNLLIKISYRRLIKIISKSIDQFCKYFEFEIQNLLFYSLFASDHKLIEFNDKVAK